MENHPNPLNRRSFLKQSSLTGAGILILPSGIMAGTLSPNGERSFPRRLLTKGHGEWNHYYIRAINGEVRLWVNGEEVSGGTACDPADGYICLDSEGSPIHFRRLRIRELP